MSPTLIQLSGDQIIQSKVNADCT